MVEIQGGPHNPMIAPHMEVWEWQIPSYLFLGGLVAGLMVLNGLWRLMGRQEEGRAITKFGAIAAPVLLSLGMGFLFWDLAYKLHVFRFYMTFRPTSPMSWGAWILVLVYPVQILTLALKGGLDRFGGPLDFLNPLWEGIKKLAAPFEKPLAWISIALGSGLGIYTGILLSASVGRPLWSSSLMGPLFLVSGLSAGTAFVLLAKPTKLEEKSMVRWDIGLLIAELAFLVLTLISLNLGQEPHREAAALLMGGPFTAPFWVFVVGVGILMPIWLEFREVLHKETPAWLGPAMVLLGGLALRFVMVLAGQASHIPSLDVLTSVLK